MSLQSKVDSLSLIFWIIDFTSQRKNRIPISISAIPNAIYPAIAPQQIAT